MRLTTIMALSNSPSWYEWTTTRLPSQHPALWRFIVYGSFRGSSSLGIPSESTFTEGWAVFDWSGSEGKYTLTKFNKPPADTIWSGAASNATAYAWASNTVVRIVGGSSDSSSDTTRHCGKITVSTSGTISFDEPLTTSCGVDAVANATFLTGWAVGYSNSICYPYANGATATSNCYVGKITATNSATNLGPLRTGISGISYFAPLTSLGSSAAGNGYAIAVRFCNGDSTIQPALINISGTTPVTSGTMSFAGTPNLYSPLHLGVRKVVITNNANRKAILLYTNSDTAPTTITQGTGVLAPTLPFRSTDVEYANITSGSMCAQNMWVAESKSAGIIAYKINANLASGESYRYYLHPAKFESVTSSALSITLLTSDIDDIAIPSDTWWYSALQQIPDYAFCFVGGPDSKASLFWRVGADSTDMNQTVFQL